MRVHNRTSRSREGPGPVSYTHLDVYKRQFLEPICRELKGATPRARIGISPGTYDKRSHRERIKRFWLETLRDTGVDLIYPQDTVGNQFVAVDRAESVWQLWKEIAEALRLSLIHI